MIRPIAVASLVAVLIIAIAVYFLGRDRAHESTAGPHVSDGAIDESSSTAVSGTASLQVSRAVPTYVVNSVIADSKKPIKETLREFEQVAKSDQGVALDLARKISSCSFVIEESTIDSMLEEGLESARVAERSQVLGEMCQGITDSDFLFALDLVDAAAAFGIPEAQIEYEAIGAQVLSRDAFLLDGERVSEYQRKAVGYLRDGARRGNPAALYRLSVLYGDGHLVPRNPGLALQNYRAYLRVSGRSSPRALQELARLEEAARQ